VVVVLSLGDDLDIASTGEGLVRSPLGRGSGSGLLHHLINLLERETLGLGNEEVSVDEGACAETTPDEEDGRLEVSALLTDHVGGDDGNDGVREPVGGGGETDTTRSDGDGEDLADDDPGTRTPGGGEPEDEDGDESNLGVDGADVVGDHTVGILGSRRRVGVVESDSDTDDGDEELADKHTKSTDEEDGSTTKSLNSPEREGSGADVDEGEDERDEEDVVDGTGGLEEGSRVVEDEVDTGPLLHHLHGGTEDGSAEVRLAVPERTLEAVGPRAEPRGGGDHLALVLLVGDDLGNLRLDVLGVLGLTTDARKSVNSLFDLATLDKVSGRVGEEEETTSKDDSPGELDTDGDLVRLHGVELLSSVDDAGGEEETDGDTELVTGDESTTNTLGANLGHVENDDSGLETDTETSNETTDNDASKRITVTSDHLDNNTNAVDSATHDDSPLATHAVGKITSDQGTEEGTARENRDDERLVALGESLGTHALDLFDEVLGAVDTVDVTGIVTEEDTSERGEGAHHVGLPGDGSLDLLDIVGSLEGDRAVSLLGVMVFNAHFGGCREEKKLAGLF
jgi:hypothetical protein